MIKLFYACLWITITIGQKVTLDYGTFVGKDTAYSRQYLGIPYAAPPVGDLRFERPRPPLPFKGIKRALHHGKACFQRQDAPPLFGYGLEISEDCLNLSIWAPRGHSDDDEPLPVLVWLLPGGFTSGYVADPLYNGGAIVANSKDEKVIVVSFNYRMGIFGWSASQEFKDAGLLNTGMHDAIAAFEWVKKYIHKFGGDPTRITAFGESAGGIMISFLLLINNGTQKLFNSAIIESGPVGYSLPLYIEFQEIFDDVVNDVGCRNSSSIINCMKQVPPSQLIENKYFRYNPYPVLDGVLISEQPSVAIKNGRISRVPLIIGTNTNEGTFFVEGNVADEGDIGPYLRSMIRYLTKNDVQTLFESYSSNSFNSSFLKAAEMISDRFFRCPSIDLAKGLANLNSVVYKYRWNHSPEILRFINFHKGVLGLGFHFSEIPFIFTERATYIGKEESKLSDALIRAWVSFAASGTPVFSSKLYPKVNWTSWPAYNIDNQSAVVFQTPVRSMHVESTDMELDKICSVWEELESKRPLVRDFYSF